MGISRSLCGTSRRFWQIPLFTVWCNHSLWAIASFFRHNYLRCGNFKRNYLSMSSDNLCAAAAKRLRDKNHE
jgi:hypothetical protein